MVEANEAADWLNGGAAPEVAAADEAGGEPDVDPDVQRDEPGPADDQALIRGQPQPFKMPPRPPPTSLAKHPPAGPPARPALDTTLITGSAGRPPPKKPPSSS